MMYLLLSYALPALLWAEGAGDLLGLVYLLVTWLLFGRPEKKD